MSTTTMQSTKTTANVFTPPESLSPLQYICISWLPSHKTCTNKNNFDLHHPPPSSSLQQESTQSDTHLVVLNATSNVNDSTLPLPFPFQSAKQKILTLMTSVQGLQVTSSIFILKTLPTKDCRKAPNPHKTPCQTPAHSPGQLFLCCQ